MKLLKAACANAARNHACSRRLQSCDTDNNTEHVTVAGSTANHSMYGMSVWAADDRRGVRPCKHVVAVPEENLHGLHGVVGAVEKNLIPSQPKSSGVHSWFCSEAVLRLRTSSFQVAFASKFCSCPNQVDHLSCTYDKNIYLAA